MGTLRTPHGDIEDLNGAVGDLNGAVGDTPWGHWGPEWEPPFRLAIGCWRCSRGCSRPPRRVLRPCLCRMRCWGWAPPSMQLSCGMRCALRCWRCCPMRYVGLAVQPWVCTGLWLHGGVRARALHCMHAWLSACAGGVRANGRAIVRVCSRRVRVCRRSSVHARRGAVVHGCACRGACGWACLQRVHAYGRAWVCNAHGCATMGVHAWVCKHAALQWGVGACVHG